MKKKIITTAAVIAVTVIVTACASSGPTNKVVLPLDHGPRAQTTPWSNHQRLLRAELEAHPKVDATSASAPDAAK